MRQFLIGLIVVLAVLTVPGLLYLASRHRPEITRAYQDCDAVSACWWVVTYADGTVANCGNCEELPSGGWQCDQDTCFVQEVPVGGK